MDRRLLIDRRPQKVEYQGDLTASYAGGGTKYATAARPSRRGARPRTPRSDSGGHDLVDASRRRAREPLVQEHHPIGERGREVQIVRPPRKQGALARDFGGDSSKSIDRVARSRCADGLVEQQHFGPLRESARARAHQLLLPARQLGDRARGADRPRRSSASPSRPPRRRRRLAELKAALVRAPTHHHDLLDRESRMRPRSLCDTTASLRRHSRDGKRREVVPEEPRCAFARPSVPDSTRSSVDLPAPLGPMTTTSSPGSARQSRRLRGSTDPSARGASRRIGVPVRLR